MPSPSGLTCTSMMMMKTSTKEKRKRWITLQQQEVRPLPPLWLLLLTLSVSKFKLVQDPSLLLIFLKCPSTPTKPNPVSKRTMAPKTLRKESVRRRHFYLFNFKVAFPGHPGRRGWSLYNGVLSQRLCRRSSWRARKLRNFRSVWDPSSLGQPTPRESRPWSVDVYMEGPCEGYELARDARVHVGMPFILYSLTQYTS